MQNTTLTAQNCIYLLKTQKGSIYMYMYVCVLKTQKGSICVCMCVYIYIYIYIVALSSLKPKTERYW